MAISYGGWNAFEYIPLARKSPQGASLRSKEPKPQRKHHYTFDVDDNGLDINGFILHTDKHNGKRHKFRVYLDSNENGRFDKNDELIGRSGLKQKHAAKGVGNLLDEGEIGQLQVKSKRDDGMLQIVQRTSESNASMRSLEAVDMDRGPLYQSGDSLHMHEEMQFITSTGNDPVASVPVDNS